MLMRHIPSIVSRDMSITLWSGRQRVAHGCNEDGERTCEIGRIGGICCKLGSTGGFLTWTRKYMTRSTYPYDDKVPWYGELIFLWVRQVST